MKKFYKVTGTALGFCFVVGIIFVIVGALMGANTVVAFSKDHCISFIDDNLRWNHKDMDTEQFSNIHIEVKAAKVDVKPSTNGRYGIECSLLGDEDSIEFINEGGNLIIRDMSSSSVFISFSFFSFTEDNKITIYVPEDVYLEKITINGDAVDTNIGQIKGAEELNVNIDAGDIDMENMSIGSADINIDAGDVDMQDIDISKLLKVYMDAGDLDVKGKIEADIDVEIDAGDVDIETGVNASYFNYKISMNVGEIDAFGHEKGGFEGEISGNHDGKYLMDIKVDIGDVTVTE